MQNLLLTAGFEAHHLQRNHHRAYRVEVGRDLFGDYVLTVCFARVGCPGTDKRYASSDLVWIQRMIRNCLMTSEPWLTHLPPPVREP